MMPAGNQLRRHTSDGIALSAILVAAVILRVWNISAQPLWGDEALTLLISQWPSEVLFFYPADPTPGLYYFLHKTLIGPTDSTVIARSISLVAGLLFIPVMYCLARAADVEGWIAATLAALSFPLIDYSQEARAYSLLVLIIAVSAVAFICWNKKRSIKELSVLVLANVLAIYTHFAALFWVGPIIVMTLAFSRGDPLSLRYARLALYITIFFTIPEAARLVAFPKDDFGWLAQASLADVLRITGEVALPLGIIDNRYWTVSTGVTLFSSLLLFAVLCLMAWLRRRSLSYWSSQNAAAAAIIVISLAVPPLMWLFGAVVQPVFMPRTMLVALPGLILMLALVASRLHRLAGSVMVMVYAISLALTGTVRQKPDWRALGQRVAEIVRPGDVVVICPTWQAPAFRHAFRGNLPVPLLTPTPAGPLLIESQLGSDPNWLKSYFTLMNDGKANPWLGRRRLVDGEAAMAGAKRILRINFDCENP